MQQAVSHRVARPYPELAAMYDNTLGVPFFVGPRRAFEELVTRYRINFPLSRGHRLRHRPFRPLSEPPLGVSTFAVDRSPAMLAIAMRNCTGCEVGLLQQDIQKEG